MHGRVCTATEGVIDVPINTCVYMHRWYGIKSLHDLHGGRVYSQYA